MIRIGIVGAGLIGRKRAEAIALLTGDLRVDLVCDIDGQKAGELGHFCGVASCADWQELTRRDDIDGVIVATPNKFIREIALSALEHGKHILCEKPLGRNAGEAEAIWAKAKERGLILKTGFNHRFHPAVRAAKRILGDGGIGKIYLMRAIYGHGGRPGYDKEWRASRDLCGGGELLDQGVHVIDLFRWFLGEFDEVFGRIATFYWDMEVEDNAFATFKTGRGQVATMHTSWTQWKNKFLLEITGEKGYLVIDGLGGSYGTEKLVIGKRKVRDSSATNPTPGIRYAGGAPDEEVLEFPGPDISWREELNEFASAILENREPIGSGYDGLMANRLVGAVYESARQDVPVHIDPFRRSE
jgi:predicted dehydrogenase